MQVLIHFKHKSMKDYWANKKYQHNKILIECDEDDIEQTADFKILDIMEIMYPKTDGAGYDTLYQYEITKIEKNPYNKGD